MIKKKLLTDRSGNLLEEIEEQAAKTLQEEIDAEILRGMFISMGWEEVVLKPMTKEHGDEIDFWVNKNTKGKHWTHGLVWLFETSTDAMWFKMRWMS